MAHIALDAMGGDRGPVETVAGAAAAAADGVDVVLVGPEAKLRDLLDEYGIDLPIVHAAETIGMGEDPGRAVREKRESSIGIAARLVRSGDVDGLVSAGSTGAALAAASVLIGRVKGVHRPAIAVLIPTPVNPTVLLDAGANPDCRPEFLAQFGMMGDLAAQVYVNLESPRVGLLNIGEERTKGRDLEREAYALLEKTPLDFVGNVEGRDLGKDRADVFVTDGFTGNVMLKTGEGIGEMVVGLVAAELMGSGTSNFGPELISRFKGLQRRFDYETFGGAHLVGTAGVVVIAHGSSSRVAIANALKMAREGAERDLVGRLGERIGELRGI